MNKNVVIGGAVAVLAIVLLALFILPTLTPSTGGDIGLTFYDEEGNPIQKTYIFQAGTTSVSAFDAIATWTATLSDATIRTFNLYATMTIKIIRNSMSGGVLGTPVTESWNSADLQGEKTFHYSLATLLDPYMDYKSEGWGIEITLALKGEGVPDGGGELITATGGATASFKINWLDGTMTLSGSVITNI